MAIINHSDKNQLAIVLEQDIRVSGEHTEKGSVISLGEGQARHLIVCNKARVATEAEVKAWNEKAKAAESKKAA